MQASVISHFRQPTLVRLGCVVLAEIIQEYSLGALSIVLTVALTAAPVFAGWYSNDWKYRKPITVDHARVSSTSQANFPVLINLAADADLAAGALTSGADILFTAADGITKLAYERELYVSASGALSAWVKVPVLDAVSDTVLYIYYGNAASADQQEQTHVWDAGYKAVWHLNESAINAEFSETLRPNAAGDETGITSQTPNSTFHWDKVDETTADDNTTYVSTTSTSYQNDLFNLTDSAVGQGVVKDVTVYFCFARNSSARTAYARAAIKTHGTTYFGTEVSRASSTYATFTHTWANNPNTGNAWTWDEINALQAGASIYISNSSYNCRVTQIYVVVNGSPYLYQDSTANARNAAPVNAPVQSVGQIDGALGFNGAASARCANAINTPMTALDNWTLQAWINPATLPQGDASAATLALYNGNGSGGYGFGIGNGSGASGNKLQGLYGTTGWHDSGFTFPAASAWYHVALVRSAGTLSYYVNGIQTINTSALTPSAVVDRFTIGSQLSTANTASRFFNGIIDEARVSEMARSADWLKTEFANQSNPSSFYTVSSQQATNSTATMLSSSANPVGAAEPIAFTAIVAPVRGSITPSGSVTFYDGTTALATLPLNAGQATLNTNLVLIGSHIITAIYSGDPSFDSSTSAPLIQDVTATAFDRLLVLLPGETAAVGSPTGRTGTPLHQIAGVAFNVTVYAMDAEWYLVNTVTDRVSVAASEPNADLSAPAALIAGTRTFSVTLNMAGSWSVIATDDVDSTKALGTSSLVTVEAPVVQQFLLPMPEEQIKTAFTTINAGAESPMVAVFSIIVTTPGAVITYDEWEDGYEADINNPISATTKIWGDGDNANGICPGFSNDPIGLTAGTVITLRNEVPIPRIHSNLFFDGGDHIGATQPVTVTRACWAKAQGPVQAVSVEVPGTLSHGRNFIVPVGQNVTANNMFTYVGLMVMADEDNTQVIIDRDGSGSAPTTHTIARGYGGALQINGGISKGATLTSTKPVQVHMITGDPSATYESRSFVLRPTELWSDQYIIPIGTENATYPCRAFIFNAHSTALTVAYTNQTSGGTLTVPANNGVLSYTLPFQSGTLLTSVDRRPFYVVCAMNDVVSGSGNQNYDWGFAPLPVEGLTTEAVCGWAPGSANMPPTENGSPVYVLPFATTTVYVDYNGDRIGPLTDPAGGKYDLALNLAALHSAKIYGTNNDQTGMRLYTLDGVVISAAWGLDPSRAGTGSPYLDMGYCLVPFPKVVFNKSSALVTDVEPVGLSLDDIMEYTLRVDNRSLLALGNSVLWDELPPQLVYQPNSAYLITNSVTLAGFSLRDNAVGTPFPLDAPGYPIPVTPHGQSLIFTFKCRIDGSGNVVNIGHFENLIASNAFVVITPVTIRGAVLVDKNGNGIRDGGEDGGLPNVMVGLLNSNGVEVATSYTDSTGAFEFSTNNVPGLEAGVYTLVETDPAGYLSTGPTNNWITVTVAAGQTSNTNFFMDASPAYSIGKARIAPVGRPAVAGEQIVFTLSVANTGNVALDPVVLEDTYDPALLSFVSASPAASTETAGMLTWANVGLLVAGETTVITTRFTAVRSTLPNVTTNRITSAAHIPMGIFVGAQTNQATAQVVAPACSITKELAFPIGRPAAVGETNIFTITVSNSGDYLLDTVPLVDSYNTNLLAFIDAEPAADDDDDDGALDWANVGPLPPGASKMITARFVAIRSGTGINTAIIAPSTTNGVPVLPSTNSVPHTAADPALQATKRVVSPFGRAAAIGEEVKFSIKVTNTGEVPIFNVPLTDAYNTNLLAFVRAEPSGYTVAAGQISWADLGALGVGADATCELWFKAVASGTGRNYAISHTTTNDIPHINVNPRVSIVKTVVAPTSYAAQMNEQVVFQITVMNEGDIPLDVVPVDDLYLPDFLTYVSSVPATDDNHNDGALRWSNVGPLAPGARVALLVTFIARAGTTKAGEINTAVTAPTTTDGVPIAPMTNSTIYRIDESIEMDSVSIGAFRLTPNGTVPHTVLAGSINRVLVVGVSVNNTPEQPGVVRNVFYGDVPLTLAGMRANVDKVVSIWVMTNPPAGTANVVACCNKWPGEGFVVGVMTLRNVDQVNPYRAFVSSVGEAGNPTITDISSAIGEVIVDTVALQGTALTAVGSGQAQRWVMSSQPLTTNPPRNYATGGGSIKAGAESVDMSWTVNHVASSNWAMGALAFRPHKTKATTQSVLISSPNSSQLGQAVTFTVAVSGAMPTPVPTGSVQFRIGGFDFGAPVDLVAGVAELEVSGLSEGLYAVTVEYFGDMAFEGSSGAASQQVLAGGVVPTLVITAIRIEGEHAAVEWPGTESWHYSVDSTPSLFPLVPWTNLWPHVDIPGINGLMSITDTNKLSGVRFYRVKMSQ